jgi:hypothetical protein
MNEIDYPSTDDTAELVAAINATGLCSARRMPPSGPQASSVQFSPRTAFTNRTAAAQEPLQEPPPQPPSHRAPAPPRPPPHRPQAQRQRKATTSVASRRPASCPPDLPDARVAQAAPSNSRFSGDETFSFLELMESVCPIGPDEWEQVATAHAKKFDTGRSADSLTIKS